MRNERLYKFSRELIKNLNYAYFALERADYKSSLCYAAYLRSLIQLRLSKWYSRSKKLIKYDLVGEEYPVDMSMVDSLGYKSYEELSTYKSLQAEVLMKTLATLLETYVKYLNETLNGDPRPLIAHIEDYAKKLVLKMGEICNIEVKV